MRNRRNTRGSNKVKELLTDQRFWGIVAILIALIVLSGMIIFYRVKKDEELLAKQKEEIENQTQEIFKSIMYDVPEESAELQYTSSVKLSIVGDILCTTDILSDGQTEGGYHFHHMFSEIAHYTQDADFAVGTLETNLTSDEFSGVKKYNSPVEFLDAVKETGIDLVSVAHNHILDYGENGYRQTIEKIEQSGISITGMENNLANEQKDFTGYIKEMKGIKIAFLSYTYGLSNEDEVTEEERKLANIYETNKVDKDFEYALANSNYVVVIMHWGDVNNSNISDWQREVKDYLIEKGADLILGSHPSVVEPIELIKKEEKDILVAYSLGNYISSYKYENAEVEMILNIEISKRSDEEKAGLASAEYIPIYVLDNGARAENRFEVKDMKKLALEYEGENDQVISRQTYNQVVQKLRWLNDLMIK